MNAGLPVPDLNVLVALSVTYVGPRSAGPRPDEVVLAEEVLGGRPSVRMVPNALSVGRSSIEVSVEHAAKNTAAKNTAAKNTAAKNMAAKNMAAKNAAGMAAGKPGHDPGRGCLMFRNARALRAYIGSLLFLAAGLLLVQAQLTAVVAAAAATAAVLLLCHAFATAAAASPIPPGRIRTAIRDRERRTAFLAQRDPDASGRPRPRAPGRPVRTAA